MRTSSDLWEALGSVEDEEFGHVLTKLFAIYEQQLAINPNNQEALNFFKNLDNALTLTKECNLNRR